MKTECMKDGWSEGWDRKWGVGWKRVDREEGSGMRRGFRGIVGGKML